LPPSYENAKMLKTNINFLQKSILFRVNKKIQLYIAFEENVKNPLPKDFEYTKEKFSILTISNPEPKAPSPDYISK
jgi:hypothetical protein